MEHREINCPVCKGPVCELDGTVESPETVWVCVYTHKHGTDAAAYRTERGAYVAAWKLANERVDQDWDDEDEMDKFKSFDDPHEALDYFHEVEGNVSYGEVFEIFESILGD